MLSRGPARLRLWLPPSPCRRLPVPGAAAAAASSASSAPTPPSSEGRTGAASPRWPPPAAGTATAAAPAHSPAAAGGPRASPLRPPPARPTPPALRGPPAPEKPGPFPFSGLGASPPARPRLVAAGNPRGAAGSRLEWRQGGGLALLAPALSSLPHALQCVAAPLGYRSSSIKFTGSCFPSWLCRGQPLAGSARPEGPVRLPRCPAARRRPWRSPRAACAGEGAGEGGREGGDFSSASPSLTPPLA